MHAAGPPAHRIARGTHLEPSKGRVDVTVPAVDLDGDVESYGVRLHTYPFHLPEQALDFLPAAAAVEQRASDAPGAYAARGGARRG